MQVDFAAGPKIELTVDLANASSKTIEIEIRDE